jgi:hypothetical protein
MSRLRFGENVSPIARGERSSVIASRTGIRRSSLNLRSPDCQSSTMKLGPISNVPARSGMPLRAPSAWLLVGTEAPRLTSTVSLRPSKRTARAPSRSARRIGPR